MEETFVSNMITLQCHAHTSRPPGLAGEWDLYRTVLARDSGHADIAIREEEQRALGVTLNHVQIFMNELLIVNWVHGVSERGSHCPSLLSYALGRKKQLREEREKEVLFLTVIKLASSVVSSTLPPT